MGTSKGRIACAYSTPRHVRSIILGVARGIDGSIAIVFQLKP
jgi:hypothetical protein